MFKKFLALMLVCNLSVHAMAEQLNASDTTLENDFQSTLELISHSKDLSLQKKSRLTRDIVICFAIGAAVGVAAVAALASGSYAYAHYKETQASNKLNNGSNKKHLRLPDPQQDLPRNIDLNIIGVATPPCGRAVENLKDMNFDKPDSFFNNGKFTHLHYAASHRDVSAEDIKEVFNDKKITKNHSIFNTASQEDKSSVTPKQAFATLKGSTPLALAALSQNKDKVDLFLEYGSNPMLQDNQGNTALHNAVANIKQSDTEYAEPGNEQQRQMVQNLINSAPGLLKTKNKAGFTPLEYMIARENSRISDDKRTPRAQAQFELLKKQLSSQ